MAVVLAAVILAMVDMVTAVGGVSRGVMVAVVVMAKAGVHHHPWLAVVV